MRFERLRTFVSAVLLSLILAGGSIGCLLTAFLLPTENMMGIAVACILLSVISAALLCRKRGGAVLLCILAPTVGYLWHAGSFSAQMIGLIGRISRVYDSAYHWGELMLPGAGGDLPTDYPLAIWGMLIILLVNLSVCRRKSSWPGILAALLPLGLCTIVTDTVPSVISLFLLLAGVVVLVFTGSIRRESTVQGNRLTAMLILPVLVSLTVLFLLIPQEGYVNRSEKGREWLRAHFEAFPTAVVQQVEQRVEQMAPVSDSYQQSVHLASLNGQQKYGRKVMEVSAESGGTLYLRGQDFDEYTGTDWICREQRSETIAGTGADLGLVSVRTLTTQQLIYFPSYPGGDMLLSGGRLENEDSALRYQFRRYTLGGTDLSPEDTVRCLQLPEQTLSRAEKILARITPENSSAAAMADAIAAYVRSSARYDRGTGAMDPSDTDFAMWFLERSDTGYCVHFASAAVVLLRAAGIPARYVTGYMTPLDSGGKADVTTDEAHAWAEYLLGTSWVILDATPPEEMAQRQEQETETASSGTTESVHTELSTEEDVVSPGAHLAGALKWLGIFPALLLLTLLQRRIRLLLRQRRREQGTKKEQAIACWQEISRMAAILHDTVPEELEHLAQKAAFSQHVLTAEETAVLEAYRRQCIRTLKQADGLHRVYHRYILALY